MTFARGFVAVVPLWIGMVPFALAYAVTARSAGLTAWETQWMSLAVFAGGAQFGAAGMFHAGASGVAIVLTTFLVNARHMLYGLALGDKLDLSRWQRLAAAHMLTDEAFGVTIVRERPTFAFLLGAETSVFVVWNLTTAAGALLAMSVPDAAALGVDVVFPLAFLALLVPLLTSFRTWIVAAATALAAIVLARWMSGGATILVVATVGAAVGSWWTQDEDAHLHADAGAPG